ncbi:hypothetical protein ACFL0D_07330 [Thermoproteota archaeon]
MEKTEFINDFNGFYVEVKKEGLEASFMDIMTLYAIYRKDIRATRMINAKNGKQEKATKKQIDYIKSLSEQKRVKISEKKLSNLTKTEASKMIEDMI